MKAETEASEGQSTVEEINMSDSPQLPQAIDLWQTTLNWHPNNDQLTQLQQVYDLILAGNQQLNLTRITTPDEFWEKHLWDSLRGMGVWQSDLETNPSPFILGNMPAKVIDIGTGAGFPGIPVAIAQPHWQVTLLDSTRKKMAFIDILITTLKLGNARTVSDRAESLGQHRLHRAHYDLALIRAVAEAPVCAEYALPLVKTGGFAILYRGQWSEADTETLKPVAAKLGGAIAHIAAFTTPLSQGIRHCIYLQKIAPTPKEFPRATGIPTKQPLVG